MGNDEGKTLIPDPDEPELKRGVRHTIIRPQ